jgi:hypothetical protein
MSKSVLIAYLVLLIILPIFLILLPSDFFDSGQTLCFSKAFFDIECLGCGITRAIQHLIHFEFYEAWLLNKLSVIVLPLLIYFYIKEIVRIKNLIKIRK